MFQDRLLRNHAPPGSTDRPPVGLHGAGIGGLVSAVIPTFNRAGLVTDALDCLASQTYKNLEVIVVDDGSTDETGSVLAAWAKRNRNVHIELVRQANMGVAAARNAGALLARGEFVYFLDSDDLIAPYGLDKLVTALRENRSAPFAVSHVANTDMDGGEIARDQCGWARQSQTSVLRNHWLISSALYRRSTLRKSGLFLTSLKTGEDTELNWRVVATSGVGVLVNEVLGARRHHDRGHLFLGNSARTNVRWAINTIAAFADWREAAQIQMQPISLRSLVGVMGLGIRAGCNGDFHDKDRAFALVKRLALLSPMRANLLRVVSRPNASPYFLALFGMIRTIKLVGSMRHHWQRSASSR